MEQTSNNIITNEEIIKITGLNKVDFVVSLLTPKTPSGNVSIYKNEIIERLSYYPVLLDKLKNFFYKDNINKFSYKDIFESSAMERANKGVDEAFYNWTLETLINLLDLKKEDYEKLNEKLSFIFSTVTDFDFESGPRLLIINGIENRSYPIVYNLIGSLATIEEFCNITPLSFDTVTYLTKTIKSRNITKKEHLKELISTEKQYITFKKYIEKSKYEIFTKLFKELNNDKEYRKVKAEMLLMNNK